MDATIPSDIFRELPPKVRTAIAESTSESLMKFITRTRYEAKLLAQNTYAWMFVITLLIISAGATLASSSDVPYMDKGVEFIDHASKQNLQWYLVAVIMVLVVLLIVLCVYFVRRNEYLVSKLIDRVEGSVKVLERKSRGD